MMTLIVNNFTLQRTATISNGYNARGRTNIIGIALKNTLRLKRQIQIHSAQKPHFTPKKKEVKQKQKHLRIELLKYHCINI